MENVSYARTVSRIGLLHVAATPRGVCKIAVGQESDNGFRTWIEQHIRPELLVEQESEIVRRALWQITEYLTGQRRAFDVPLDVRGTDFQRAVWSAVAGIPYGHTRSYTDVAETIGRPSAVRAVGAANGANPLPLIIPCHRVLGKHGALTGYGGGLDIKRLLLEMELA